VPPNVPRQEVARGVKDRRDQHQDCRWLDHPGTGSQHDKDSDHPHDHCGPPPGADLFPQEDDGQKRDDDRADIGHGHRIGQWHGGKADEEGDVRDHDDGDPRQMRQRAAGGDLRKAAWRKTDHRQDEGHGDEGANQDHLMQCIAAGQELDRHVIDGKDQRAASGEKDPGQGLRACHAGT